MHFFVIDLMFEKFNKDYRIFYLELSTYTHCDSSFPVTYKHYKLRFVIRRVQNLQESGAGVIYSGVEFMIKINDN